jgi:chromosome segregation ATPase
MPTVPSGAPAWVWLVSILVSGGLFGYIRDWVKQRRITKETPQTVREQISVNSATDSSLSIVARARDELAEDNDRLRAELADERENLKVLRSTIYREREDWSKREARYLARIDHLETSVNSLREEIHNLRTEIQTQRRGEA